jgi:hypothetical protein
MPKLITIRYVKDSNQLDIQDKDVQPTDRIQFKGIPNDARGATLSWLSKTLFTVSSPQPVSNGFVLTVSPEMDLSGTEALTLRFDAPLGASFGPKVAVGTLDPTGNA